VPVILIGLLVAILALVGVTIYVVNKRPNVGAAGKSWLDYGNFFIVALGIVAVLVAFLIAMLLTIDTQLFKDSTEILAVLTALFGVIGTLVGTYFGVKAGGDAAEGATNLAGNAITPGTIQPTVTVVSPPPSTTQVSPSTQVNATFSKGMNPATLTNQSFTLVNTATSTAVNGVINYNPTLKQATLAPASTLTANTTYRATITTDVRDLTGSPLSASVTWEFTVA
jgi:hypothetical protein